MIRRLARRLPEPARRGVRRIAHRWSGVAVVVVLDGEPTAARRCLVSALAQDGAEVVVVVLDHELTSLVPDGTTRLLMPGASYAEARLAGVRATHAARICVVVPGADLLPGALAPLAALPVGLRV
ncbi:MAG: hypothetical protein JWO46_1543, partial [Nocardioidaceae bacterium]|nr:hypothetical protein [Nocardioidaceae bacterium]